MTSTVPSPEPNQVPEPGRRLVGEWAVCGIAAAAARFIPVPLLDDAVRQRATRIAVTRTLRANGRDYPADAVEALYAGADAGFGGPLRDALGYLRSVPRRVALFPVRKYVAIFGAVRGVPTDVMTVLLLGRTVHRVLAQGRLAGSAQVTGPSDPAESSRRPGSAPAAGRSDAATSSKVARASQAAGSSDPKALGREAQQIRRAFDDVLAGMDLRLLTGALADGLSQGKGLTQAAVGYARRSFGRDGAEPVLRPGGQVGQGVERVEEVLARPEITRLLQEFDTRLDTRLNARA